jgi:hypothetical protein
MENSEFFYKQAIDSIAENEIIKCINNEIAQASEKGLFEVKGEYKNNEINPDSFVEYFRHLGFKVLYLNYDQYTWKWSYKISWFKH